MKFIVIQENGRHERNRSFRECFCVQRALVKLGHECDVWGLGHDNYSQVPDWDRYDVVINLENYDENRWVPSLADVKAFKIQWVIDAHFRGILPYQLKNRQDNYNLVLQATHDYVDQLPNSIWFPNCYDNTLVGPTGDSKKYFIGFCGNVLNRGNALALIDQLFGIKQDIMAIGPDMVAAINSYQIHFNRNHSTDINYRSFETIGCGTVLLTNRNRQYDALGFVSDVNCIVYDDDRDMLAKINHYQRAENQDRLKEIAAAGYELSVRHTYFHRMAKLVMLLQQTPNRPKISLIHATRGRPIQAVECRDRFIGSAQFAQAVEHIFIVDEDDCASIDHFNEVGIKYVTVEPGGGCVRAWNAGARVCSGDIIVQLSDDWNPPMNWDTIIRNRIGDCNKPAVLAVSDGHRKDSLLCMAILTRARFKEQSNTMFHPEFLSVYSDDYFTRCAIRDKVIVDAKDVVFEHMHPSFGKGDIDQTYKDSNSTERYDSGYQTFLRLINDVDFPTRRG